MLRVSSIIFFLVFSVTSKGFTQTVPQSVRDVSGAILDSLHKPISGSLVKLITNKDTLSTSTNAYGFYQFKGVKSAEFMLSVKALGYQQFNRRYFNNDTKSILNISPILLKSQNIQLTEVEIKNKRGPSVKGDTTEFWANDYIVREYARLEDLLRRMEGITIDPDGTVYYNGEMVVKALFNGVKYFGGSVREAMKELPADIVQRIQIIDQNETADGSKDLKTDKGSKVLNVVTKADKAAGKLFDISLQQGTQKRTKVNASAKTIDAGSQYAVFGNYENTPTGLMPSIPPGSISRTGTIKINAGGAGGEQKNVGSGFSFSQGGRWNLNHRYQYSYETQHSSKSEIGEQYYSSGLLFSDQTVNNVARDHSHEWTTEYNLASKKQAVLSGAVNLRYGKTINNFFKNNIRTGIIDNRQADQSESKSNRPAINLLSNYRNKINEIWSFSSKLLLDWKEHQNNRLEKTELFDFGNNSSIPDSVIHLTRADNANNFVYTLNNRMLHKVSKRLNFTYNIDPSGQYSDQYNNVTLSNLFQDSLSNQIKYLRNSLPISYGMEYELSKHITISPILEIENNWLHGRMKQSALPVNRYDLFFNPKIAFLFSLNNFGLLRFNYSIRSTQPGIQELSAETYYQTLYDITTGNSLLKNPRSQILSTSYNLFLKPIKLNFFFNGMISSTENQITSDRRIIIEENLVKTVNSFININGANNSLINLEVSRNFDNPSVTLKMFSSLSRNTSPYLLNGFLAKRRYHRESIGLNTYLIPAKWIDLNLEIGYNNQANNNFIYNGIRDSYNKDLNIGFKSGVSLPKNIVINIDLKYSALQNTNILTANNRFVMNMNFEKRIFSKKNGIISFVVMDLAKQNQFTNYQSSDLGYTNTISNPNSRYFLIQFAWRPQLWSKSKYDKGIRKGDGSFINPIK